MRRLLFGDWKMDKGLVNALDDLLCRRWTLLILLLLANRKRMRYTELLDELNGISPKTLAERLRTLENAGIVRKEYYKEVPPRVEYSLTGKGMELVRSMSPMLKWANKWMSGKRG